VSAFDGWTIKDYLQDLVNDIVSGTMRLTNLPRHLGMNKSRSQLHLFIHIHSNGNLQIVLYFNEYMQTTMPFVGDFVVKIWSGFSHFQQTGLDQNKSYR
jgi:hypothetical protein